MAPPVADIDAHRTVRLRFFGLRFFDTLLHKAGLLLHLRMRCGQHHSLFRETSRLIPSKAVPGKVYPKWHEPTRRDVARYVSETRSCAAHRFWLRATPTLEPL